MLMVHPHTSSGNAVQTKKMTCTLLSDLHVVWYVQNKYFKEILHVVLHSKIYNVLGFARIGEVLFNIWSRYFGILDFNFGVILLKKKTGNS